MVGYEIEVRDSNDYKGRRKDGRFYVESNLGDLPDAWFARHDLWSVKFPSKTWKRILRRVNRTINRTILDNEPTVTKCSYSRKAGCRCGCSPGYIVKHGYFGKSVHVKITYPDSTLDEFREFLVKMNVAFEKEVIAHAE